MSKQDSNPLKNTAIVSLYLIYMFDLAAIVIVLVLFSTLLLSPDSLMLPLKTSIHQRNVILGLLFAAYPITQFMGAPILGEFSDRFGRKTIIQVSTLGTVAAFFLSALSILDSNLVLLFLSRLIGGFFAGNASLAQATVSELVSSQHRSRAMAIFSIVGGFAWIIGPFIGVLFSNSHLVSWFGLDTPFWILGLAFLACWGTFMLSYATVDKPKEKQRLSLFQTFRNLTTIFHHKIILVPFICSLFSIFCWMIVQDFLSSFLFEKFSFTQKYIGLTFAYMSFWWLMGGLFAAIFFKKLPPSKLIAPAQFLAALMIFIYTIDHTHKFIYWAVPLANFSFAVVLSSYMALFAHLLPANMQGKLYGSWTGGFALANAIGPAFAGWISFLGVDVPFQLASFFMLLPMGAIYVWSQRNQKKLSDLHV